MPLLNSSLTIAAGQTITLTDPDTGSWGYEVAPGSLVSFTNSGTVNVSGDTEADLLVNASVIGFHQPFGAGEGSQFWNRSTGVFTVTASGLDGDAIGVRGAGAFPASVRNDGAIEVTADRGAFGVLGFGSTFENSGSLTVTAGGSALGSGFNGSVVNSGLISVTGGGTAVGVNIQGQDFSLSNSGEIDATSTGPFASIGAAFANADDTTLSISNAAGGVISGDFALKELQLFVSFVYSGQSVDNAGTLNGAVDLGLGVDRVVNSGAINGYVALGEGADNYSGGGFVSGQIFGGYGDDTIAATGATGRIYGEEGDDSLSGGGVDDWIDGGHDQDTLSGGGGADELYGGYGDDVISGGDGDDELDGWFGADRIIGGAGADVVVISFAPQSSSSTYDTVVGFNYAEDKFRIPDAPDLINASVTTGSLSLATFDLDLSAALSPGVLSAGGAVLYTPTSGSLASQTFLVVDQNGVAGYQSGGDIVVRLEAPVGSGGLSLANFVAGASFYARLPLDFNSSPLEGSGREIHGDFTIHAEERLIVEGTGDHAGIVIVNRMNAFPSPVVTVTIAGDFFVTGGNPRALEPTQISSAFDLTFQNTASGHVRIEGDNAGLGNARHFQNDGLIEVIGVSGDASGAAIYSTDGSFVNTGDIHISAFGDATGVGLNDAGMDSIFNNSGEIIVTAGPSATGPSSTGPAGAVGVNYGRSDAEFINSGVIRVTESSVNAESVGVEFSRFEFQEVVVFQNSGTIEATWAFREHLILTTVQASREKIVNSGLIKGRIDLAAGADEIINSNRIIGDIFLRDGGDLYDGGSGSLTGLLSGGNGNDTLNGGITAEVIHGDAGDDSILGGANADTIQGGLGNDTLDGGTAFDTVDYSDRTDGGVNVNIQNGQTLTGGFVNAAGFYQGGAQEDTIVNLENINGTNFADRLIAGSTSARIEGRGGNDFLFTFSGNDTLFGGEGNDFLSTANSTDRLFGENGNDTLNGGTGFDTLDGGANTDTADYSDRTGGVSVNLFNGTGITGGALNASGFYAGGFTEDSLVSIENVIGSAFGDRLVGLSAGSRLDGRGGNDNISGLSGADTLIGGLGNDALAGGAGSDTFEFAAGFGADRLTDFVEGAGAGDVIRLVGLGALFDSFAEVIAAASQSGADVVFNFGGGNTITVLNATVAGFAANDFAFG